MSSFKMFIGECPGAEGLDFDDSNWSNFEVGGTWGGYDVLAWFRAHVMIPEIARGKKLSLHFLVGPRDGGGSTAETLLFVNGAALQGIDVWHEDAWLPDEMVEHGEILVALKAWSGVLDVPAVRRFKTAELVWIDEGAERFYHLVKPLLDGVKTMAEEDLRRIQLLKALDEAFRSVNFLNPGSESYYLSISEAERTLRAQIAAWQGVEEIKPRVTCIGHAHIDMAWLWRLKHTREKAAHTFSTALHLMRQYPEYRFMHSSPALYQYLKQDYPEIYACVREKIASGQWEITGGMWVEADTNLISGESLVRQLLFGKRFAREEFGQEMTVLWLPDVFGYSAALPQILKKSGIRSFLTTKISWSQFNRFPYDTFYWRGLDGSEILTHFITTPEENSHFFTYNGQLRAEDVQGVWKNYQQKEINQELLMLFGWGDGGGGPTQEMLESARAFRNLPGMPRVDLGRVEPYFDRLHAQVDGQDLPVWDGELYLEYHRGTYTSQAEIKRLNRKAEILYREAEWLGAMADVLTGSSHYPAEALQAGWEKLLVDQFHDILPGSSIREVYQDAAQDHLEIRRIGEAAIEEAEQAIVEKLALPGGGLVVFNSLPWERDAVLAVNPHEAPPQAEKQPVIEKGVEKVLINARCVPGLGYRAFSQTGDELATLAQSEWAPVENMLHTLGGDSLPQEDLSTLLKKPTLPTTPGLRVGPNFLENAWYRIDLNIHGQIINLWDKKNNRQVLPAGARANVLQAFEDKPMNFDAWDIDIYYQQKLTEVRDLQEACVEETGPLRGSLRLKWRFAGSTITQWMRIYRDSPRIDFKTEVDWHEHQVLLKVAFPVAVRSSRATYDVQFGALERPTHWNTSWDWARFEVVGHKWADLSEGNYGVALLNDCKYGYDVKDNILRLTLIKSGIDPDPMADQGLHEFTYALLPHAGDWRVGNVVKESYALNNPLRWVYTAGGGDGSLGAQGQFAHLKGEGVMIETIKRAEDGDGWIIRVYEYQQNRIGNARVGFGRPLCKAVECNLMEEEPRPVEWDAEGIRFAMTPFEIKTFRVWFEGYG